jgi:hypothetical protein
MKKISVSLPIISIFFLDALIDNRLVSVVIKKIRKEPFLFCNTEYEDEEFREEINPRIIQSTEPPPKLSNEEEGIFACKNSEDKSEEFKSGLAIFKPLHISITRNTDKGDKVSLEWFNSTWQIFENNQKLPENTSLKEIFF